ncbi:MAG: hypothetical protein AUJ92_16445 [Armatimonadetes bacterium CG2_30_59_28]|nr:type II toxin-antitoxin system RelE/ParE family toxin [Armatimonadota bacterium]OIO91503.1 MAG: hypothetical protein AUJ92_16445 [Armatimonadetes bacterium CG2_30_59_28]PIU65938.1 MAG: type II toxin-antitoxin system RelE/ParE family toxin [Armatimonadetes bacterium CG07_land_8_20_14_0_80_59_28]PIX40837.1 MAG: type II toxin-antitoxin system RelE/ParE family toxin [Armatimonadetes bacterium CG_4_8_14_3_um_filter_58_9]PIY43317.1 MAG: type II toxin-antitoxin system RelE/ParE family toxin [Armati
MVKVIWTEPALTDIEDIIEYISRDSMAYAARVGTSIVEAPRRLEEFPRCGRVVPEFENGNIRELIYGSYRIIYVIREEGCFIVAVTHGSRDILRHIDSGGWDILTYLS